VSSCFRHVHLLFCDSAVTDHTVFHRATHGLHVTAPSASSYACCNLFSQHSVRHVDVGTVWSLGIKFLFFFWIVTTVPPFHIKNIFTGAPQIVADSSVDIALL
jgi:hypothetical protein